MAGLGCWQSFATSVTPGFSNNGTGDRWRLLTRPFMVPMRWIRKPSCSGRRTSTRSGKRWTSYPWNSARWWSFGSWKACRTRRLPPLRRFPWARSCRAWPGPAIGCTSDWAKVGPGDRNVNCDEVTKLLHVYVDGELDLTQNLDMDEHLQACPGCAQACADLQAL